MLHLMLMSMFISLSYGMKYDFLLANGPTHQFKRFLFFFHIVIQNMISKCKVEDVHFSNNAKIEL